MEEISKIKVNLEKTKNILQELNSIVLAYEKANEKEKALLEKSSNALSSQLALVYEPVSIMLPTLRLEEGKPETIEMREMKERKIQRISTTTGPIYISEESKRQFLEELNLSETALRGIKSKVFKKAQEEEKILVAKPSSLAIFASKIFGPMASGYSKSPLFKSVEKDLRKANMPYMLTSYISLIFFLTFLAFIVSIIIAIGLATSLSTALRNIVFALVFTAVVFLIALTYPSSIASANKSKIETELPFATAHMAAIASSKVTPAKIFSIMALTKEYPAFGAEVRKIVNQINIYGYDLTTALRNVAKTTSSRKLADLFNGIATTITTGGNLPLYLNEKSKNLLLDYRLSRERYTNVIGMYSDIYTALLIAAPLIFMLILAIMSVLGTTFLAMDATAVANIGIVIIAILNILFLVFLRFTQPEV